MFRPNPMRLTSSFRNRLAGGLVALAVACAVAPTAHAQGARGGIANLFVPDFLPRDLPMFVDSLGLEEWQRPILELMLEDYGADFATAADGVRAKMGQLKDVASSADSSKIVELIASPLVSWGDEKKALREKFMDNVRSQLSEVQLEAWPRLERAIRREKSLPNGVLSGEALNLVMITREIDVPPVVLDAARGVIDEYEVRLDASLAARDAADEASIPTRLKALNDVEKYLASDERVMALRVAVREAQDQGMVAIRDALGPDYGAKFELRALRRAFPQVYGPDPINPLFEAAFALPDLTAEQKGKLEEIRTTFASEHGSLQTRYAQTIRQTEPKEPRRRAEALKIKAAGGNPAQGESAEIDAVKLERQEMYTRYRAKIAEVLNDQQKESVPGFGKPGADLAAGQKYSDASHLGTGGGAAGPKPNTPMPGAAEEHIDPAIKPRKADKPGMNDTRPGGPQPGEAPKKAE